MAGMNPHVPRVLAALAGLLPLIGFFVPVVAYDGGFDEQYLHEMPVALTHLPFVVFALIVAAIAWPKLPGRVWGAIAMVVSVALVASLFPLLGQWLCWDGVDAQGNPIGGCENTVAAAGFWASSLAGALLFTAGTLQFVTSWPKRKPAPGAYDAFRADAYPTSRQR